ncbi:MAG: glycosyltransferase family protein [Myxococcota bacterium]
MRIAYGVHGYTRGHATRAASVLTDLTRRHDVLIFAGGDAYEALKHRFDVVKIRTLGFSYGKGGKMSKLDTIRRNVPKLWDICARGPHFARITKRMKAFGPDVVISDAEAWTHRAALALRIPRIGFDHFGVMVYCRVPMPLGDRVISFLDRSIYRFLMGAPERVLVSSFYGARPNSLDVRIVGPLVGDDVSELAPTDAGHLLCYLNMGASQLSSRVMEALVHCGVPVRAYGPGLTSVSAPEHVRFHEPNRSGFLRDLASCHAVLSTAGNQLVGEALHLGKPLLVMPEATVEQRLNGASVARMGIGELSSFDDIDAAAIQKFLARRAEYAAAAAAHASNGRREALERLETWFHELARKRPTRALPVTG